MKAIQKLRSQDGASLIISLTLFLVCAVISSVVIVAATAVGGRASQLPEMDQRYYAVSSAAELIRDLVEEQTITVMTGTKNTVEAYQDTTGVVVTPEHKKEDDVALTQEVWLNGVEVGDDKSTVLVNAARKLSNPSDTTLSKDWELNLTAEGSKVDDKLSADVKIALADNGTMTVIVSNVHEDKQQTFTMSLTFESDQSVREERNVVNGQWEIKEGKYTRKSTETVKQYKTFKWHMSHIQNGAVKTTETPISEPPISEPEG